MVEARLGSRTSIAAFVLAISLTFSGLATAKPKPESKDEAATRLEKKAVQSYVAHDAASAGRMLEHALRSCEPPKGCTPKTVARLHVSLGTVKGAGEGDYASAKKEFAAALALDPEAQLNPALSNAELRSAFAEAHGAASPPEKPPTVEKPPDKPPISVTEFLHPEEGPQPAPAKRPVAPPPPSGPEARWNWFSVRMIVDFAYFGDANICSPGAPPGYFCTDEGGARYGGRPQPNDEVSRGFALSTGRLVLGYERLLFAGFTAGAFVGYAIPFAKSPSERSGLLPLHVEARASYAFGSSPYADTGARLVPFVFLAGGAQQLDSHVVIRVSEIPCTSRVDVACKRDLDAYRLTGGAFAALGGGARFRLDGPHAVRAAIKTSIGLNDGTFAVSPELVYELGF